MSNSAKPSAAVIASAILAILGGLLFLLVSAIGFLGILSSSSAGHGELTAFARNSALGSIALLTGTSVFAIAVGTGLVLLRNWARICALVLAGFCVFFGAIGVIVFTITAVLPQPANLPPQQMWIFRTVLAAIYGVPLATGTWWLILFNRKAIKSQFTGPAVPIDPNLPKKPRCPTPIAVLAWLFIACVLDIPFLAFMPNIPLLLFGHVIGGPAGRMCFILMFLLFAVLGIGLLKLKPWSYHLTLAMQFFFLSSGIVTLLSPNFRAISRALILQMENSIPRSESGFSLLDYPHYMDWAMGFGLLFAVGVLVMLVYYRGRFLELAATAGKP